ncbi:TetR/AcrR family transcriptional regulator [Nocardioides humilatus]|uniref:TetR/AcrR family transcriptional regulator n=1 Tax=Nocardioides humilatus TaxID=2607660 RepID=A0A5B1L8A4_9ACTN|nr:TetR/AcrR family transcriptional regulator [Nocardioides humilatus]
MRRQRNRDDFFEAAMQILATEGYVGLKQGRLCDLLGVTTGSFYRHFPNWLAFKTDLLEAWRQSRTLELVAMADRLPDPLVRLHELRKATLDLPHRAEAAIRTWTANDEDVAAVQQDVDEQRLAVTTAAMHELFTDPETARNYAHMGLFLLVGFEQLEHPHDVAQLDWTFQKFLAHVQEHCDSGRPVQS